ncbi:unnamed protein product [Ascophyllum nodosum]
MGSIRRHGLGIVLVLVMCLPRYPSLGHGDKLEKENRYGKSPKRFGSKPARDYSNVDPSFEATLEGSMTGGQAQLDVETQLAGEAHSRLESLLRGVRTEECRKEIMDAYQTYMGAQALERALPFEGSKFTSQCVDSAKRPDVPPTGILDPQEVRLVYVILAHEEPAQVIRLVNALDDEPGKERTWFIVHSDVKADGVYHDLVAAFKDRPNVIMMDEGRLDVAWGGFNVVQATLNAVALALEKELPFNWLWILSGTTYPIASNDDIRARLASHHPEAIFMESKTAPHKPASTTWHYFVECDSALHRIGRSVQPRGIEMQVHSLQITSVQYVGSQWLAMPPAAARWLMEDKSLVPKYREYSKHIVVADENFLPTMFKNSPFCGHQVASNLVHVQFDRYEHTLDREDRRMDKCLMPNPDHCGRSPATMTLDYLSVLEHSDMLFARKFDPKDAEVFDVLDRVRAGDQPWRKGPTFDSVAIQSVARWSGSKGEVSLCLSLEDSARNKSFARRNNGVVSGGGKVEATMVRCSEKNPHQIFTLGPCGSDGHLELGEGGKGFMQSSLGEVTGRSPSCSITSSKGACLDLLGEAKDPGAPAISYKCHNRWNQFFSFGEGKLKGHVLSIVPRHLAMADQLEGAALCLEAVPSDGGTVMVQTAECSPERYAQTGFKRGP